VTALALPAGLTENPAADRVRDLLGHRVLGPIAKIVLTFLATYGAIAFFAIVVVHKRVPYAGPLVYGGTLGLLYGMVSFGIILVYRANRFINFAQAQIGSASAILATMLVKFHGWPYLAAIPVALAAGALSGFLVDLVIVRRFAKAPRLVLTVASIGVTLLFAVLQFEAKLHLGGRFLDPSPPRTPFSGLRFEIYPQIFTGNHILVPVVVGLVMVALMVFFKRTDVGMAIRGSAENADRALLLGISVRRLSAFVWVIAGAMSALGVFLRIPLIGVPVGPDIGPSILLFALTAAVIAKFESFPIALGAAVVLGVLEQAIYVLTGDPNVAQAVLLPILLVAMLAQKGKLSRGQDTGMSSFRQVTEFRPIPPELADLPEVQWGRFAAIGLPLLVAIGLPYVMHLEQQILGGIVLLYGIVAVSLVILTGWAGQISLGQWGFAGVGALVGGWMSSHVHADFFSSLVLAGLVGAAVSLVIGLPALRIQGLYLAITTLAFGLAVQVFLLSPLYFQRFLPTAQNPIRRPLLYEHFSTDGPRAMYYLCLGALVLCILSATALRKSRTGRVMIAARDNERGAQAFGVSIARARLAAFAISGFWSAVAGALYANHQQVVETAGFGYDLNLLMLIIVVIGGVTSIPGALLGTAWIGLLRYGGLDPQLQVFGNGAGVLILLWVLPGGLAQVLYGARDSLLRYAANRRGILVPSLVADARSDDPLPETQAGLGSGRLALPLGATATAGAVAYSRDLPAVSPNAPPSMLRRAVECPVCRVLVPLAGIDGHDHFQVVDL
jgi:branched-chain amino acid transport system permease protein